MGALITVVFVFMHICAAVYHKVGRASAPAGSDKPTAFKKLL